MVLVYCIVNNINEKQYVGITSRKLSLRLKEHCSSDSGCPAIRDAIKKYGIENFSTRILTSVNTIEEAY